MHERHSKQNVWRKANTKFLPNNTQDIFKHGEVSILAGDVFPVRSIVCSLYGQKNGFIPTFGHF